jgi:hypothetical protein
MIQSNCRKNAEHAKKSEKRKEKRIEFRTSGTHLLGNSFRFFLATLLAALMCETRAREGCLNVAGNFFGKLGSLFIVRVRFVDGRTAR